MNSTASRIGFVAHQVHRHGGMERAAAEVIDRIQRVRPVTVFSSICEVEGANLRWIPVHGHAGQSTLYGWTFARAARRAQRQHPCQWIISIGSAALDADVIVSQFCHAAFQHRLGGARGGSNPLRRLMHRASQWGDTQLERRAYHSSRLRRVLAVSSGVANDIATCYAVPRDMIRRVPNGVDRTIFRPAREPDGKSRLRRTLGLPEDAMIALFVGGDWHRKGLADVIAAIGMLPDVVLVVVGAGDIPSFSRMAEDAGAAGRVTFAGPTPNPQSYYAAADVFTFPSRYEAFSLATLEAAASGLPLITLRINGTEELVQDGVTGFFVEPGPDGLARRLDDLRDPAMRVAMGLAARDATAAYEWDRIAGAYLDTIDELLADSSASRES